MNHPKNWQVLGEVSWFLEKDQDQTFWPFNDANNSHQCLLLVEIYIYMFELAIGWSSKILVIISFCLETKKKEKKKNKCFYKKCFPWAVVFNGKAPDMIFYTKK